MEKPNNKEIYEGDIVVILGDMAFVEYGHQDIGHDFQGVGFFTREKNGNQFNIFGEDDIEIIGNRWETPKLDMLK